MTREFRLKLEIYGLLLIATLFALGAPLALKAAMSKSKAYTEAHKIWGDWSHVEQGITWGETYDTYQIGFNSPGCAVPFVAVGTGVNSWDAAFAALPANKGISVTVTGMLEWVLDSPPPMLPLPPSDSTQGTVVPPNIFLSADPIPGKIAAAQLYVDGKTFDSLQVVSDLPWTLRIHLDSTKLTNGQHVVCSKFYRADSSFNYSTPAMIMVANP